MVQPLPPHEQHGSCDAVLLPAAGGGGSGLRGYEMKASETAASEPSTSVSVVPSTSRDGAVTRRDSCSAPAISHVRPYSILRPLSPMK